MRTLGGLARGGSRASPAVRTGILYMLVLRSLKWGPTGQLRISCFWCCLCCLCNKLARHEDPNTNMQRCCLPSRREFVRFGPWPRGLLGTISMAAFSIPSPSLLTQYPTTKLDRQAWKTGPLDAPPAGKPTSLPCAPGHQPTKPPEQFTPTPIDVTRPAGLPAGMVDGLATKLKY